MAAGAAVAVTDDQVVTSPAAAVMFGVQSGNLPGQLDSRGTGAVAAGAEAVGAEIADMQTPYPLPPQPSPDPPRALVAPEGPSRGLVPPQSLLRPLALLDASPDPPDGGTKTYIGPPGLHTASWRSATAAPGAPPLRSQETATTATTGVDIDLSARATASTAAATSSSPPVVQDAAAALPDLGRYANAEAVRSITRIQAAQRGNAARRKVAAMRANLTHQGVGVPLSPDAVADGDAGSDLVEDSSARTSPPGDLAPSELVVEAAVPEGAEGVDPLKVRTSTPRHPFADSAQVQAEGQEQGRGRLPPLLGSRASGVPGGGSPLAPSRGSAAAVAIPVSDLSRYEDPEAVKKIIRIQAAQRGRMVRKQVAQMREQQQ